MPREENQSNPLPHAMLDERVRGREGPMYMHVYRRLAQLIDDGALMEGSRLPPTRFLARQLAVSRFTVTYAYDLLAADGYITGRGRAGTFVRGLADRRSTRTETSAAWPQPSRPSSPVPLFGVATAPVEFFPRKVWSNLVKRRLANLGVADLMAGDPQGHAVLRRALANRLAITRGIACSPEQVFITAGIAGATALVAEAMLRRGDRVLVEDPADPRCHAALQSAGARLVPVPVDRQGMRVEDGLAACPDPRLIVVTPCGQFPLGVSLSPRRRSMLLDAGVRQGGWVLEHDIQSDYRFRGAQPRSLASEPSARNVIYALHLSEILFPALGISCVAVPAALVDRFRDASERLPPVPGPAEQAALVDLVRRGHILRYFNTAFAACARRREALHDAFDAIGKRVYVPDAGLHLIAAVERSIDAAALAAMQEYGMAPVPMEHYATTACVPPALVVGFASVHESHARDAVRLLSRVVPLAG